MRRKYRRAREGLRAGRRPVHQERAGSPEVHHVMRRGGTAVPGTPPFLREENRPGLPIRHQQRMGRQPGTDPCGCGAPGHRPNDGRKREGAVRLELSATLPPSVNALRKLCLSSSGFETGRSNSNGTGRNCFPGSSAGRETSTTDLTKDKDKEGDRNVQRVPSNGEVGLRRLHRAAHNIALAGVAEGLAVTWETGGPTRHPELARTLGAEDDWELATMLSIGYPDEDPPSQRTPVSNYVRWLE